LHRWTLSAPATFSYVLVFSALTMVQRTAPPQLINLLTQMDSTSLSRLEQAPVTALVDSALWVADKGSGLVLYVLVFSTAVAWAERKYGSPRIIFIGLSGHVFGSLLTVLVEYAAIKSGRASSKLAHVTDVGVSYIMVAGCVAAVLLMRRWWLWMCGLVLAAFIVLPVFTSQTIWDLGHLLATACGLLMAFLSLRIAPVRDVPKVRDLLYEESFVLS
jgi:hypothetical protein